MRGRPDPGGKAAAALPAVILIALAAAVLFVYSPSLRAPFIMDDWSNIHDNPLIRMTTLDRTSLARAVTPAEHLNPRRPIAFLTFALNHYFHGYDTAGYRLTNVAILLLSIPAAYGLALLLCRTWLRGGTAGAAALGATLLWTLHPLLTNGITYIVQRMTSLAALFALVSLACLFRGVRERKPSWWGGGLLFWVLALGTKETAALLPLVFLLFLWLQPERGGGGARRAGSLLLAAVAASLIVLLVASGRGDLFHEQPLAGGERFLTEGRVIMRYISLFLLPLPSRLNLDYAFLPSSSLLSPYSTLLSFFLHGLLIAGALRARRRRPLLSFGLLSFYLLNLLEGTFLPLAVINEYRAYLPSYFLSLALVDALVWLFDRKSPGTKGARVLGIALLTGATWGAMTYHRNTTWADPFRLWSDVVAKAPLNSRGHNNLGIVLLESGREEESIPFFSEAARIDPAWRKPHYNLGLAYSTLGRHREALESLEEALLRQGDSLGALAKRGESQWALGMKEEAILSYREALRLRPDVPGLHVNLGFLHGSLGQPDRAAHHFGQAIALKPDDPQIRYYLGLSSLEAGRVEEARAEQKILARLDPDLGRLLLKKIGEAGRPSSPPAAEEDPPGQESYEIPRH